VNGPDKQPARFPLDLTADELAESCGLDTYRVYALDEVGNVLDYVTTVETARELRNAADPEVTSLPLRGPSIGSDLRYALETVTHIARTNADAMRAVAESQAEWIKSISSARGFFRNAPPVQTPENVASSEAEEDDELDHKSDWVEAITPIVGIVVQQLVASLSGAKKPSAGNVKLELADLFDWRRVERKREALVEAPAPDESAIDPAALKQALAGKALVVSQLLEPSERERLMKLTPSLMQLVADPEVSKILAELVAMPAQDAAAWIRENLDKIEKGLLS